MESSNLKFQCFLCFSINSIDKKQLGHQHTCTSCGKIVQLPNSSFSSGRVIANDFVLQKKLGSGAMGSVFLARQLSMDRLVALKLLFFKYTNDERFANDFKEEAKAAARLNHINIVQSFAFGSDHDILYLAMNYINGETLGELLERFTRLKLDDSLNIVQQIAEGLHAAWSEMKLIHRDIKPANILITENGVAKISDFGLARKEEKSTSEAISGSPAYMSPEQFANKRLDCRSDIYALGITLFELLTGELPFKGKNATEVAYKHLNDPVPVTKMVPKVPRVIRSLIKKMTAKNPEDRFQTPEELVTKIVEIRKNMAVDHAMISNVHTMSIKKHKYTSPTRRGQLGSEKIKTLVEYHDSAVDQKNDHEKNKFRIFVSLFLVGLILFLFLLNSFSSNNVRSKDIIRTIKSYSSNIEVLDKEADKRHIALVKLFNLLSRKVTENTEASELFSRELRNIKSEVGERKNKITEFMEATDKSEKNYNSIIEETKLRTMKTEQGLMKSYQQILWNEILEAGFYYKFKKVKAILTRERINGPSWNREWLEQREIELASIFSLQNSLKSSPLEVIGVKLEAGTIIASSATKTTFLLKGNSSEKPQKVTWYNLSSTDIATLTSPAWTNAITNTTAIKNLKFLTLFLSPIDSDTKEIMTNFFITFSDEMKALEDLNEDIEKRKQRLFTRIKGMKIEGLIRNKFNIVETKEIINEKN
ncbi:MAG: serine/threonine protein kinase [Lentisphaeria bacterium]|nr:serine/threonine protein kinase [Lentisphaeria bacterium]